MRVEQFTTATLYLGDCREILPTLPRPDAIVSDPPYGQRVKQNVRYKGGSKTRMMPQKNGGVMALTGNEWPDEMLGDDKPFDPAHLLEASDRVMLWGAHRFGHQLPKGRWLGWDKKPTGMTGDQGDGELAWTNVRPDDAFRMIRLLWVGTIAGVGARHEVTGGQKRVHPTQKPELIMRWSIEQADVPRPGLICDPYMGSGSTGVAAVQLGREFVGIEKFEQYFDTACRRIEATERQQSLAFD